MPDLRSEVLAELDTILDPCSVANGTPMGLVEMGLLDALEINDAGAVTISLRLTSPFCHMIGHFKTEARQRLLALRGVTSVTLLADNGLDWLPERMSASAQMLRNERLQHMQSMAEANRNVTR